MATIPQVTDFGARPSLRSNRVDPADRSGLIMADAIGNAANKFAVVLEERQGKKEALAYANTKAEFQAEDIRLRRELSEDKDHATFEERYRTGMTAARERFGANIGNNHDRAIWDADAGLSIERGVSAVTEFGRKLRIDEENAGLASMLESSIDGILSQPDAGTRNDMLMNALEGIEAAVAKGNRTALEGEKMRQDYVERVALAEITMMGPQEAIPALQAAIEAKEHRGTRRPMYVAGERPGGMIEEGNLNLKARPEVAMPDGSTATVRSMSFEEDGVEILVPTVSPDGTIWSDDEAIDNYHETGEHLGKFETADQATGYADSLHNQQDDFYRQSEGSGSLADFLHLDVQHKLLEAALKENKTTLDRGMAFDIVDRSWELFPNAEQAGDRAKYRREQTKGNPDVRAVAQTQGNSREIVEENAKRATQQGIMDSIEAQLLESRDMAKDSGYGYLQQFTADHIPPDQLGQLEPAQQAQLKAYSELLERGLEFAEETDWSGAWAEWRAMGPEARVAENINNAKWKSRIALPQWNTMLDDKERAQTTLGGTITLDDGMPPEEMLSQYLSGMKMIPLTKRTVDHESQFSTMLWQLQLRITQKSSVVGHELTYAERMTEMAGLFVEAAGIVPEAGGFWSSIMGDVTESLDREFLRPIAPLWGGNQYSPEAGPGQLESTAGMTMAELDEVTLPWAQAATDVYSVPDRNGRLVPQSAEQVLRQMAESADMFPSDEDYARAYWAMSNGLGDNEVLRRLSGVRFVGQ